MPREQKAGSGALLKQRLENLAQVDLINLLLNFAEADEDFERKLLKAVTLPPEIKKPPPDNPALVSQLKRQITRFFDRLDENLDSYYEEGPLSEITDFVNDIQNLGPADQLIVLPHLLEAANAALTDYGFSTNQLEEAIRLYAQAADALQLTFSEKKTYFDQLSGWLTELDIWEYGADTVVLKKTLEILATTPEDYRYLIQQINRRLNQSGEGLLEATQAERLTELTDWLAAFYLKIGDEVNYLKVRQNHLETEAQYYELAVYWQQRGQLEKYRDALEGWLNWLNQPPQERRRYRSWTEDYRRSYSAMLGERIISGIVLEKLAEYYRERHDRENLLRILLAQAQHREATFELYQAVKILALELGRWKEAQERYLGYVRHDAKVLAQIYLFEQEWDAALKLAQEQSRYGYTVIDLVGQGIKERYPREAIGLYEKLVSENIAEADRKHYHFAAEYAARIKQIYLEITKDPVAWQGYISQIRDNNRRRKALQDEFKAL